jgi:Nitroreductase family
MDSHLGIEDVLTTIRAVRKRLDFSKPVERQVIEECLTDAQQAPNGGNLQTWGFVVITNRDSVATEGCTTRGCMRDDVLIDSLQDRREYIRVE